MVFHHARLGAMRAAIEELIRHRPPSLLARLDGSVQPAIRMRVECGLKSAPIYQIINQAARYEDLDRLLSPPSASGAAGGPADRQAPIELYQVAETYFVKDGNRRVSEARARGQLFLLARVTECLIDGRLDDPADMYTQLLLAEYHDFLSFTGLARIRPAQQIECTALGGYAELTRQIETYRAELAARLGYPIEPHLAVASWYDALYTPIIAALRRQRLLESLPARREADLYLWVTSRNIQPASKAPVSESLPSFPRDSIMRLVAELRCA
jgi:hypothetical protein